MSQIFLVISRQPFSLSNSIYDRLETLGNRLLKPHNVSRRFQIETDHKDALAVFPENKGIKRVGKNLLAGAFATSGNEWVNETNIPTDASLRILVNDSRCSVESNSTASRSVWYYHDDNIFIASTSQRAVIAWIGNFRPQQQAVSWMIACGNLGPGYSWDQRIHHVGASQKTELNRDNWELKISTGKTELQPDKNKNYHQAITETEKLINDSVSSVNISLNESVLTLSGGYDSRTVLHYLVKNNKPVQAVTWGVSDAMHEADTDASIAKKLADYCNIPYSYYETDFRDKFFDNVFQKFLFSTEGRIDHINSFMDGFKMWEQLNNQGFKNVIRGDECFGWLFCNSSQDVRVSLDMHMMEDMANMFPLQDYGLEKQKYPEWTLRREKESLESWRDRLYSTFRIPYVLTTLHDAVSPYVEIYNPFLKNEIVQFYKTLPDDARTNKKLYVQLASRLFKNIPVARKSSIPEPTAILWSARIVSMMLEYLNSKKARQIFDKSFIHHIISNLKVNDDFLNRTNNSVALWIRSQIPWKIKKLLRRDLLRYQGDYNQIAFRACIVIAMHNILEDDQHALTKRETNV